MKHFIFFIFLCGWCTQLSAQQEQLVYKINPFGKDVILTKAPFGSTVKVLVTNVNPFVVHGSAVVVKQDLGLDSTVNIAAILPNGLPGIAGVPANDEKPSNVDTSLLKIKPAELKLRIDFVKTKPKRNKATSKAQQVDIKRIDSLRKAFEYHCQQFVTSANVLRRYVSAEDYIDSLLKRPFIEDTAVFISSLESYMRYTVNASDPDIDKIRGAVVKQLDSLTHSYFLAKEAYQLLHVPAATKPVPVEVKITAPREGFIVKIEKDKNTADDQQPLSKEFTLLSEKFEKINKKRMEIIAKANRGVDWYHRIMKSAFTVVVSTAKFDNDIVMVPARLTNDSGKLIKAFDEITFRTDGGLKIDMSTGYLLSFRSDETYSYYYNEKGIAGIQKSRKDPLKHAVGLLFHAYARKAKGLTYGGSLGVSAPTDGLAVGFYFGGSLFLMERNRLVLTAGCAFNRYKLLNTGNLGNGGTDKYTFVNTNDTEIHYDQVYRPALFIGFTYNLFSLKK